VSNLWQPVTPSPAADQICLDQCEAARISRLSAKTLGRLADAGEPVGRVKIGRRVLYHRGILEAWILSKAAVVRPATPESGPAN
jgi:hypothetical protein